MLRKLTLAILGALLLVALALGVNTAMKASRQVAVTALAPLPVDEAGAVTRLMLGAHARAPQTLPAE